MPGWYRASSAFCTRAWGSTGAVATTSRTTRAQPTCRPVTRATGSRIFSHASRPGDGGQDFPPGRDEDLTKEYAVPAEAGTHLPGDKAAAGWIPAFAGKALGRLSEAVAQRLLYLRGLHPGEAHPFQGARVAGEIPAGQRLRQED